VVLGLDTLEKVHARERARNPLRINDLIQYYKMILLSESASALLGERLCPFIGPRARFTIHGSLVCIHRSLRQGLHCKAHRQLAL
jgi:hypothetical protein